MYPSLLLKTFWGKSSEMLIFHQRRENLSAQKDNFGGSSQDIFLFAILSIISSCHCSPLLQYFQLESASLFNSDEIIDVFAKFSSILFVIASSRNCSDIDITLHLENFRITAFQLQQNASSPFTTSIKRVQKWITHKTG